MKYIKYVRRLILLTIVIAGCDCNQRNEERVKKFLLSNGRYSIAPYYINNGDTLIDGKVKYYSKDGILEDEIEYKKSKRNGWHIHYKDGTMEYKILLSNDYPSGKGYFFDNNGRLETENTYFDGNLVSSKTFHKNGRIESVNFIFLGVPFYGLKFDSLGKKLIEKGVVFYDFVCNQPLDSIRSNSLFEIKIPIVSLPEYLTNVQIARFNAKNEVIDVVDSIAIFNNVGVYNTRFIDTGIYKLGIAAEIKDSFGKTIQKDTIYRTLVVRP